MFKKFRQSSILFSVFSILWTLLACESQPQESSLSPTEALQSFQLEENFQIELIAAEPLVADPIAMEIDEAGRMYVLEMHGYPMDLSGSGKVKLLSDTDGDGVMDDSKVFVEGLRLPTGIMRWKQGILITDPPNLLYFEDRDQDGKAEIKDTLLTGFALSNPQHNFNTPIYGIDNWIYVGNESTYTAKVFPELFGDEGSDVHFPALDNGPVLHNNAAGRSVRLKPDEYKLENLSSYTQYGQTFDRWGRHLLVSNANHIYQEVIPARYLQRNPELLVSDATESIAIHGSAADVYPVTENPDHQLLTDLGVFTSACGIVAYQGGLFSDDFMNTSFVAEPVSNIVHVDLLKEDGAALQASRKYEEKEFLASKDAWFRPVSLYIGPDGALYIIDYYRQIIEHPEWMSDDVIESGALYNGTDLGRIYRISPKNTKALDWSNNVDLETATAETLVDYLGHPNIWYRKNAQRLLVDRQEVSIASLLKKGILSNDNPDFRFHALWTLQGLKKLEVSDVLAGLEDDEAGIRENAIILAEDFLTTSASVPEKLLTMANDENARVRFQLLCTLGYLSSEQAQKIRAKILFQDVQDKWVQMAALSAPMEENKALLAEVVQQFPKGDPAYFDLTERLTAMLVSKKNADMLSRQLTKALRTSGKDEIDWPSAFLSGLAQGIRSKRIALFSERQYGPALLSVLFDEKQNFTFRSNALKLIQTFSNASASESDIAKAETLLKSNQTVPETKVILLQWLAYLDRPEFKSLYISQLSPIESPEVQTSALNAYGALSNSDFINYVLENWSSFTSEVRDQAINLFLHSDERVKALIVAMEEGVIDPAVVGWRRSVELMAQQEDTDWRNRARAIFTGSAKETDRSEIIAQYQAALSTSGKVEKGQLIFEKNCSICHQMGGENGVAFGPDLKTIKNRRPAAILADILDPNLSIADGYDLWKITLTTGEVVQGIIASEAVNAITLRKSAGQETVISRAEIQSLESMGMSLMPNGLEQQISVTDMADLLEYIKKSK